MTTVTIPSNLTKQGDLVLIPRKDYEEFLSLRKVIHLAKPTKSELSAIRRGRKEVKNGKYKFLSNIKYEMADGPH